MERFLHILTHSSTVFVWITSWIIAKPVITEEDKELFAKWNEAKAAKDFTAADECRAKLMENGLI